MARRPRKPRNPKGIRPRVKDEKQYERELREKFFNPFIEGMQQRLARATAATDVYYALDAGLEEITLRPKEGVPEPLIRKQINHMERYHRTKLFSTFRSALGVDIRPFITQPAVEAFMRNKVSENVDLIKTIAPRFHEGMKTKLTKALQEQPFNQQMLRGIFKDEYKSSGYNLRRLTRDQTNKSIGQLTQIRHSQLGVSQFVWRSVQDERVRPLHNTYNGRTFEWGREPDGGPGSAIQCRCFAEGVVFQYQLNQWQGGSSSQIGISPSLA